MPIASKIEKSGILEDERLRDKEGKLDPEKFASAMQVAAERKARPTPEVLLAQMEERVLPALRAGIEKNLQNQLEIFIPAQRAIQYAAEPLAPYGRGLVPLQPGPAGGMPQPDLGGVTGLTTQAAPLMTQATAATGFMPQAMAGTTPPPQTRFEGVRQSAIDSFHEYEAEASSVIKSINALAAEGNRVLAQELGVPDSVIAELTGMGARIDELRGEQANIRLDVEMSQYNRQLTLAQRTLGDLAGLTGREGGTYIGQLQRQDMLLSRRGQMLSVQSAQLGLQTTQLGLQSAELGQQQNILQLELAQRKVNFQLATAGFTAPGTTPEERAARIEEAKVEASYAQREIDFQRQQLTIQGKVLVINREQAALQAQGVALSQQQFANQVALQDAMNNRAYQDQLDTIAEMQKAAQAQDEIAARQGMIDLITKQRDEFVKGLEKQVEAEETFISEMTKFTVDIMEKTGVFTTEVVTQVTEIFNKIRSAPSPFPTWMTGGTPADEPIRGPDAAYDQQPATSDSGEYQGPSSDATLNQEGFSGRVSSATQMIMGEAGAEEVAILKNPRSAMLGGGGGGGVNVNVTVTGNNITANDEAETAAWADKIARMIEDRMGQRAMQLGFRAAR